MVCVEPLSVPGLKQSRVNAVKVYRSVCYSLKLHYLTVFALLRIFTNQLGLYPYAVASLNVDPRLVGSYHALIKNRAHGSVLGKLVPEAVGAFVYA